MGPECAGIPLATKLLKAAPGYDLYRGVQMPYGSGSADFACPNSETSKNVCELPGDVTVSAVLSPFLPPQADHFLVKNGCLPVC